MERRSKDSGERSNWVSHRTKKALNVLKVCFGYGEQPSSEDRKVGQSSANAEISRRHEKQILTDNHRSNEKNSLGALFSKKDDLSELNVQAPVSSDKFDIGSHRDDTFHQSAAVPKDLKPYLEQRIKTLTEANQYANQVYGSKEKIEKALTFIPELFKDRVEQLKDRYSTTTEESLKKIRKMFDPASVYEEALKNLKEASDKLTLLGDTSNQWKQVHNDKEQAEKVLSYAPALSSSKYELFNKYKRDLRSFRKSKNACIKNFASCSDK